MKQVVGVGLAHESATGHVTGAATYIDDLPVIAGTLHAAVGKSEIAHGKLTKLNLSAVAAAAGVQAVISYADVLGDGDITSTAIPGDYLFAKDELEYAGQPIFAVAADSFNQARRAVKLAKVTARKLPAILTIEQAIAAKSYLVKPTQLPRFEKNYLPAKFAKSTYVLTGQFDSGAQEHFYLEGQIGYAIPQEANTLKVYSSTQHPTEVQHNVARVLGIDMKAVEVVVRRMGGGFGGKETQAAGPACMGALLAYKTGRPVKLRYPRADDFLITGKRHPFWGSYKVGFDQHGKLEVIDMVLAGDCGCSPDLSMPIVNRAMFHADNGYHLPSVRITGLPCKTNKPSNTAFRGFGGPQGMLLIEKVMDDVARHLGLDPLAVRQANLYKGRKQLTPYHQTVSDNVLPELVSSLASRGNYASRRKKVDKFNATNKFIKKGLALTPVKFGISFTFTPYNQAGALVNIYYDGSIKLNHGGTEMGQGLFTKVAQITANELGVPLAMVKCSATNTDKIPNTSATAASAGSDLNGMAAYRAARKLRLRLTEFAAVTYKVKLAAVKFVDGQVYLGRTRKISFQELIKQAYAVRISLSEASHYVTPKVYFDVAKGRGRPFYYFAYGAAISEVAVDVLTGEHRLLRVDILHDVGQSINPAIDLGQIEGGFTQGFGWLTCEEMVWDQQGRMQSTGPASYKIPTAADMPKEFNVWLWEKPNQEDTVFRSKAVGEPPLMGAISVVHALADAVHAASGRGCLPVQLKAPATPEQVKLAIIERCKQTGHDVS